MSYLPNIKYRYLRVRAIVWWSLVLCVLIFGSTFYITAPAPHICLCLRQGLSLSVYEWVDERMCTWIGVSNNAGAASLACGWPHVVFVVLFKWSSLSSYIRSYRHPFECNRIPASKICMKPNFECNWIAAHKSLEKRLNWYKCKSIFKSIQTIFQLSQKYCFFVLLKIFELCKFWAW